MSAGYLCGRYITVSCTVWYDLFSLFYDRALEDLYAPYRPAAVEALGLSPGACVLDLPCGTGQSLDLLVPRGGPKGRVLGVDRSADLSREAWRPLKARCADFKARGPASRPDDVRRRAVCSFGHAGSTVALRTFGPLAEAISYRLCGIAVHPSGSLKEWGNVHPARSST